MFRKPKNRIPKNIISFFMFRKLKNRNLVIAFDGWIMLLCLKEIQRNNTRLFRDLSFGFLNLEVVTSERYLTSRLCAVTIPIHRLLSGPSWSIWSFTIAQRVMVRVLVCCQVMHPFKGLQVGHSRLSNSSTYTTCCQRFVLDTFLFCFENTTFHVRILHTSTYGMVHIFLY
jgi:hypothetical protein